LFAVANEFGHGGFLSGFAVSGWPVAVSRLRLAV
jgi:hypothetical protein